MDSRATRKKKRMDRAIRSKKGVVVTLKELASGKFAGVPAATFERLAQRAETCLASLHYRVDHYPHAPSQVRVQNRRNCRSRMCPSWQPYLAYITYKRFCAAIDQIPKLEGDGVRAIMITFTLPAQDMATATVATIQKALKRFWM